MNSMSLAPFTVLLHFYSVRIIFLIFNACIVSSFTISTS
jgi:hypothetical protein